MAGDMYLENIEEYVFDEDKVVSKVLYGDTNGIK